MRRLPLLLSRTVAPLLSSALLACADSSSPPVLSDDLRRDLARAGGADVQLAGSSAPRVDVVSAAERVTSPAPAPRAPLATRTASPRRGVRAPLPTARHAEPAPAPRVAAPESAPTEAPSAEPLPEPAQTRPLPPLPSPQREPPGGWRRPSDVIRNAPFPITP